MSAREGSAAAVVDQQNRNRSIDNSRRIPGKLLLSSSCNRKMKSPSNLP
jgi:hypothetical protein